MTLTACTVRSVQEAVLPEESGNEGSGVCTSAPAQQIERDDPDDTMRTSTREMAGHPTGSPPSGPRTAQKSIDNPHGALGYPTKRGASIRTDGRRGGEAPGQPLPTSAKPTTADPDAYGGARDIPAGSDVDAWVAQKYSCGHERVEGQIPAEQQVPRDMHGLHEFGLPPDRIAELLTSDPTNGMVASRRPKATGATRLRRPASRPGHLMT